jgi:hypothetical protein
MADNPSSVKLADAGKGLVVKIREENRDAVRRSPSRCVAANRLRQVPRVIDARVGARSARLHYKGVGWVRYDLDPDTAAAIRAYDLAGETMPAGFRVQLSPPKNRLGARVGEKPGSNKRSGRRESVATRRQSTRSLFIEPAL